MFCVSRNGWGWDNFIKEADSGNGMKFPGMLRWYMNFILPIIVVGIYLKGYYDTFAPKGTAFLIGWGIFALGFLCYIGWLIFGRKKK